MASPQVEDGYTRIANELLEAIYKSDLSGAEFRVLLCILRKTYGFNSKSTSIKQAEISNRTGLHKSTISRVVGILMSRNIVKVNGAVGINKDWEEWEEVSKMGQSCETETSESFQMETKKVSKMGQKVSKWKPDTIYIKRNSKEIDILNSISTDTPEILPSGMPENLPPNNAAAPLPLKSDFIKACIAVLDEKRGLTKTATGADFKGISRLWDMDVKDANELSKCYDWLRARWDKDNHMSGTPISVQTIVKYYPEYKRVGSKAKEWNVWG